MDIISQINTLQAASNGEFSSLDEDNMVLETAYIEVLDYSEMQESLNVTTASTKSVLSGVSASRVNEIKESRKIKVQFNPSSLDFSTSGGSVKSGEGIDSRKKKKKKKSNNDDDVAPKRNNKIDMTIKLVFDRTVYIDSSVMPEVEGFLAMIKNPYTRTIVFHWGNLYYKGLLTSVNAEYTMFNSFGIPVRADITLRMEIFS